LNWLNEQFLKASLKGDLKQVESLLKAGANLFARGFALDETALHFAVESGNVDLVRFLLEKGIDVNAKQSFGETPLHYAASHGHANVAKLLVEKKEIC